MPPMVARLYVRMFLRVDVLDDVEAVIFRSLRLGYETMKLSSVGILAFLCDFGFFGLTSE